MDKQRCEAQIPGRTRSDSFRGHSCAKAAVNFEDGKHYCKIHTPSVIAAKRKAEQEKWQAKYAEGEKVRMREKLIAQLTQHVTLEDLEAGRVRVIVD